MKLLKVVEKKYRDKKMAELLDNIKDFNYFDLDKDEIVDVIKPIIESMEAYFGRKITGVRSTSVDVFDEKCLDDDKTYPGFGFKFVIGCDNGSEFRVSVRINPFGCVYVGLTQGMEIIDAHLLRKKITVELIKFLKGKYGKSYAQKCKKFLVISKSSYIKDMQSSINILQIQIDDCKRKIKEMEEMYDENSLGLN